MLVDLRSLIRRKLFDRSRKGVQRAWFDEKIVAVVTLGRSTCPAHRENRCSGHSRASNVPGSAREPFERSRKGVQRAWFDEKTVEVVTQERPTFPAQRENRCSGHARASNVPGSAREPFER